jgi:hypothetical protein
MNSILFRGGKVLVRESKDHVHVVTFGVLIEGTKIVDILAPLRGHQSHRMRGRDRLVGICRERIDIYGGRS